MPEPVVMEGRLQGQIMLGNVGERAWHVIRLCVDPLQNRTDGAYERLSAMMDDAGLVRVTVEPLVAANDAQAREIVEGLPEELRQLVVSQMEDDDGHQGSH